MRVRFWKKNPKPKTLSLNSYQGWWIAVLNDEVVAHARTARDMMDYIEANNGLLSGCTAWYEPRPEEVMHWSVQYRSRPGYVCPNCLFSTREDAEAWVKCSAIAGNEIGSVWTRNDQHDPWRLAR